MEQEDYDALQELLSMPKEQLALVTFTPVKLRCCVRDCNHFTTVRDYGTSPYYGWRKRFLCLCNTSFYCGKHYRQFKAGVLLSYKPGPGLRQLDFLC